MRTAIIGTGMQCSRYAAMIASGNVKGMELAAMTRFREQYRQLLKPALDQDTPVFQSADELFEAVDGGSLMIDAVIITTPHLSHEQIALAAFRRELHVLCDKPAGVTSSQARRMDEAAKSCGCIYGMIFNQRALAINQKIHEIIESGVSLLMETLYSQYS